jgi:hypothetical protein
MGNIDEYTKELVENLSETQKYMLENLIRSLEAGEDVYDELVMLLLGTPYIDYLKEIFKQKDD